MQVPEGWQSGKIFNWSQQSKDQLFRGRIANYLLTCEMPCTVEAVAQIKKNVLNACIETVASDGVIQEDEAELLRAIADTLDCPMPPLIDNV